MGRWMIVIYNNATTSYNAVIEALIAATQCELEEAEIETWEAHTFGKAAVHFSSQSECETAAQLIHAIGVRTDVCPEWAD